MTQTAGVLTDLVPVSLYRFSRRDCVPPQNDVGNVSQNDGTSVIWILTSYIDSHVGTTSLLRMTWGNVSQNDVRVSFVSIVSCVLHVIARSLKGDVAILKFGAFIINVRLFVTDDAYSRSFDRFSTCQSIQILTSGLRPSSE